MIIVDLKHCITEALNAKKISASQASELTNFVNNLSETPYYEIGYSEFNKNTSQGLTFKDSTRTATFSVSNPIIIGNVSEEKVFDALNVLSTSFHTISNLQVYNDEKTILYVDTTDYTVDLATGEITRVLTGAIEEEAIVHLEYHSKQAQTIGTAVLETNSIKPGKGYLKSIKIDADNENVSFQLSKNNSDFFDITSYNIYELLESSDTIKVRVVTTSPNTIRRLMLITNKSLN